MYFGMGDPIQLPPTRHGLAILIWRDFAKPVN